MGYPLVRHNSHPYDGFVGGWMYDWRGECARPRTCMWALLV